MKRISLVLLSVLLLAALVPFTLVARANNPAQAGATPTGADGNDCDHDNGHDPGDDVCTPTPTALFSPTPTATGTLTETVTPTATGTLTATPTAGACAPEEANFTSVPVGSSVTGLGAVAANVNIAARYSAVHVQANVAPEVYAAGPGNTILNGGLDVLNDAFGDVQAHQNRQAAHFTFTFASGMTVTDFKLHMIDYGDWNPLLGTNHAVTMRAFNATNQLVSSQVLSYTSPAEKLPKASNKYGNLQTNGDALSAPAGMPGNWLWDVSGTGITRVTLDVGAGPDPNFALDGMFVTFACP